MNQQSRRALLGSTAGVIALAAGCIDDAGVSEDDSGPADGGDTDGDNDENETTPGDDSEDETETEIDADATAFEAIDAVSYQQPDAPADPEAGLLISREDAENWLEERDLDDDDELVTLVEETAFDEALIVAVEAEAPDLCHELTLTDVSLDESDDDARVAVSTAVSDESDDEEMCAQQITAVGQLVRVAFEGDPVTRASVTVFDDGRTHEIGIASDSDSASETEGGDSDA